MKLLDHGLAVVLIVANKVVTTFYSIPIPLAAIQALIATKFPIHKQSSLWTFTLCDPVVRLNETANKIGIELTLCLTAMGNIRYEWRGLLEGRVKYNRTAGEFYLGDLAIRQNGSTDGLDRYIGSLLVVAEALLEKIFSTTPLYRLEQSKLQHVLARLLINSVTVKQDRVVLELSLY